MRKFSSGATRNNDGNSLDFEGFLSPDVLIRYAQYMHRHRKQADGKLRDSDNWQKGIPVQQYIKSKCRHLIETWRLWRKQYHTPVIMGELEESLCAELFNTMGMLHEILKGKEKK